MVFDAQGNLYVLCREGPSYLGAVRVLGPAPGHRFVRTLGRGSLAQVADVAMDDQGSLYVVEYTAPPDPAGHVAVFDGTGTRTRTVALDGGDLSEVWSVAVDGQRQVFIGSVVIARFAPDGTLSGTVGQIGDSAGQIRWAHALVFDPRGSLWLADLARNNIQQYDAVTGAFVREVGGKGSGPGQFDDAADAGFTRWGPSRIALDRDGMIYANDPYASRIQKLSRSGVMLAEYRFGGAQDIGPVAIDPASGNVYVGRVDAIDVLCPLR